MLKNKLFFFNFFIFAFYFESFAMKEREENNLEEQPYSLANGDIEGSSYNQLNNFRNSNRFQNRFQNDGTGPYPNLSNNLILGNMTEDFNNRSSNPLQKDEVDSSKKDKVNYFIVGSDKPLKNFNKLVHIFFYFVISPILNVNNLEWRHYFFQGQLNKGGVFFYYGLLNFGIGFNRKTFWDTCSCRIIGLNLFQFLGSFVLYFFVDQHENIKTRWNKKGGFPFFLFNATYFEEYIGNIDSESEIPGIVREGSFMSFISYSFAMFPFLSFFTFDFQLFEYLSFSLNVGSFLFLTVAFFIYTFYRHTGKPFGNISNVVNKYDNIFKDSK